ncbi:MULTISPECIES: helix-turn-helix domain-containing protein [Microbulbifer]|uniref:helix-turn-helix domain-containing protein n=1 Tax=Microbulbifer TaxID=48073 RepID=UPI001E4C649C|nr:MULTISPECIES: helix-turn-helix domain-containing protein [Microbulbifer]UHQ55269.1 helix-turn-helix domain-containing protein [Microbulbifer sp. YPW16]
MSTPVAGNVAVILLPGFPMGALGVLMERFALADQSPQVYSLGGTAVAARHGVRIQAEVLPAVPGSRQALFICGGRQYSGEPLSAAMHERLAAHAGRAGNCIGVGSGVLLLAQLGLLAGRACSAPAELHSQLRAQEPRLALASQGVSQDRNIWTCADGDMLTSILDSLLAGWRAPGSGPGDAPRGEVGDRALLTEAQALMRSNLSEPLTTGEIADYLQVTSKKLERVFKRLSGQLPARFYIGLRLALARDLLHHSDLSIEEIGKRCGFGSPSHFSRAFRNYFGCTPREERQHPVHPGFSRGRSGGNPGCGPTTGTTYRECLR